MHLIRVQLQSVKVYASCDPSGARVKLHSARRMETQQIIIICLVLAMASGLQTVAGFGFGMVAIPLMMLVGDLQSFEAIAIATICVITQTAIAAHHLRRHIDWRVVGAMVGLAGVTVPLGVLIQHQATELDPERVGQVYGVLILLALIARHVWRIEPRPSLHRGWMLVAMGACGTLAGFAGMGGPPAVMWVMAHTWSAAKARVTLWMLFIGIAPVQLILMSLKFGGDVPRAAGLGLLFAPACLLGLIPGLWIGKHLSSSHLRIIAELILLAISMSVIFRPIF